MYKALNKQVYKSGNYTITPLRFEDRLDIMKWRNEQIYHLRQNKPLTEIDQDNYFKNVIQILFNQNLPDQILFSFLKNDVCIGYGGLVHINWTDKNAEISFIEISNPKHRSTINSISNFGAFSSNSLRFVPLLIVILFNVFPCSSMRTPLVLDAPPSIPIYSFIK